MTVRELIERLNSMDDSFKDWSVVIPYRTRFICGRPGAEVNQVTCGFDWSSGRVFLWPDKTLYVKEE